MSSRDLSGSHPHPFCSQGGINYMLIEASGFNTIKKNDMRAVYTSNKYGSSEMSEVVFPC